MKLRVYNSQTSIVLWEGVADSEQAALDAAARAAGYSDNASIPDEVRSNRRQAIDAAKAAFARSHGLAGASNSAITKAWKRAGKPTV